MITQSALRRGFWGLGLLAGMSLPPRSWPRPSPLPRKHPRDARSNPLAPPTKDMVAAANPLAAQAGREILAAGGSAVDAAIAVQLVLNLVEPQSSGIGGGAFMVFWDGNDHDDPRRPRDGACGRKARALSRA